MPVTLETAPPIDLGQASEPFGLDLFNGSLQLGEVLFEPRIRQLGQDVAAIELDRGAEFAHVHTSNMCSRLALRLRRLCEIGHITSEPLSRLHDES